MRVSKQEWNALQDNEKIKRCKAFALHFKEHDRLGLPTDLSHMIEVADNIGTPVPNDLFGVPNFKGYDTPTTEQRLCNEPN